MRMFTIFKEKFHHYSSIDRGGDVPGILSKRLYSKVQKEIVESTDIAFLRQIAETRKVRLNIGQELYNYLLEYMTSQPFFFVNEGLNSFWASFEDAQVRLLYERGMYQIRIELLSEGKSPTTLKNEADFIENPIWAMLHNFHYVVSKQSHTLSGQVRAKTGEVLNAETMKKKTPLPENPRDYTPEAWLLFRELGDERFPYETTIDEQRFMLSEQYDEWNRSIVGMTELWWVYHMRLFYYSNSGWNWHCAPGFVSGNLKSKWYLIRSDGMDKLEMSYENGTVVDDRLAKVLERIPMSRRAFPDVSRERRYNADGSIAAWWQHAWTPLVDPGINDYVLGDMRKDGISVTPLIRDTREFARIFRDGIAHEFNESKFSQVFHSIALPPDLTENLRYSGKWKTWKHHILNAEVNSYVFESVFQWKTIKIEYAVSSDDPENGWIENIYFSDSTMSTWWFRREQIHAGLLRTKPLEYAYQCPAFMDTYGKKYGKYIDIRPYTQINPLIIAIKKLLPY